jgi:hypothetical protein
MADIFKNKSREIYSHGGKVKEAKKTYFKKVVRARLKRELQKIYKEN